MSCGGPRGRIFGVPLRWVVLPLFAMTWLLVNVALWYYYEPVQNDFGDIEGLPHLHDAKLHKAKGVPSVDENSVSSFEEDEPELCDVIDVVYTWVNGSDPKQVELLNKYKQHVSLDLARRFREYGILRFSMRSVETFMPYIRNIILVTNGQVPTWLNTSASRFRLVTHDQIFPNKEDLPTFNSNAIEAHLHKIPGVAPCFLYLNDDFFIAKPTPKAHFVDLETGHLKLYMDGFVAPEVERMKTNIWHKSVGFSNEMINSYYYPNSTSPVKHNYAGHHCYFIKKEIADVMYSRWHTEFDRTSRNRFRQERDTAFPFIHANVAIEEFGATKERSPNFGGAWTANHTLNTALWSKLKSMRPFCVCLQDDLEFDAQSDKEIAYLQSLLCEMFPTKSSLEKRDEPELCLP
ncbi:n-acetylglucosamine-1-phosphotransferase subunits alpha beta [Pelomyxa schiedti]|nr:n-acetylglucosamine-1-phosphotransferase subunits alpha beta [Pelomyxa schiedti]